MSQEMFKIASISENKKNATNGAGKRFFIPEPLRATIKVGDYMLIGIRTFTSHKDPTTGEMVPCAPWDREDVTFAGSKDDALGFVTESDVLALEAQGVIKATAERLGVTMKPIALTAEEQARFAAAIV